MSDSMLGLAALGSVFRPFMPPPEDDPYFAALGRFITSYAGAEGYVHELVRKLSRLSEPRARVVFGGMRLGDLSERIRGLMRVSNAGAKTYNEVDACLTQLDIISTQRNKLVHRFVKYHDKKIMVTNFQIAKSFASVELEYLTLNDFTNMDHDCTAITLRLIHVYAPKQRKASDPATLEWLRRPWRYKPVPPYTRQRRPPKAPQSQPPPPPASGGSP